MTNNVLLVYPQPDVNKAHRFGYPLMLLYASSSLKQYGFNVSFVDYSVTDFELSAFSQRLDEVSYVVVEIDAFPLKRSTNISNAENIAKYVKNEFSHIHVISIGKHCSLVGKEIQPFDLTIAGEAESILPSILQNISQFHGYIDVGLIESLDALPFPDRSLLDYNLICGMTISSEARLAPSALLETSRGCPGSCSFCQRKGWGHSIRFFDIQRVVEEFDYLISSGVLNIWIVDENFTGDLKRAKELLRRLSAARGTRPVKIAISSWARVDNEFMDVAKQAGISLISFGIESVDKEILSFYHKTVDLEALSDSLKYAHDLGIYTIGNFIIGAPSETRETVQKSLSFAIESYLDDVNVKTLDYMLGSEIYESLDTEKIAGALHVFSCSEEGLCSFPKSIIKELVQDFISQFRESRLSQRLKKIREHGVPYYTKICMPDT